MEVYSLTEFNTYVKQVIALNFVDSVWITCEISQFTDRRGNAYLDLVEKDEITDEIKAQSSAAIWFSEYSFIKKKLGTKAEQILQAGMLVKLKVEADFHVRYGFKLLVKDIDPTFTFGQLAIQREKTIERLIEEKRMDINGEIPIPTVIQNIAIISSDTAAGYKDFTTHLANNPFGYIFHTTLFPAAMQGSRLEMEVIAQLKEINNQNFDLVVITRGGGSKLDLSGFDSYHVAKQISEMDIPVMTGIGHEIDETIADLVSSINCKTPTAAANYLVDHNMQYEANINELGIAINQLASAKIHQLDQFFKDFPLMMKKEIGRNLTFKLEQIELWKEQLPQLIKRIANNRHNQLEQMQHFFEAVNPKKLLQKGYAIIYKNGEYINDIKQVSIDDKVQITLKNGTLTSIVTEKNKNNA